jgi:hypothetical protein
VSLSETVLPPTLTVTAALFVTVDGHLALDAVAWLHL